MTGPRYRKAIPADTSFGIASNHPYECKCDICKLWWEEVPPEYEFGCPACGWEGTEAQTVHPKHAPEHKNCPDCYESLERL